VVPVLRLQLGRLRYAWLVIGIFAGRYLATAIYFPPLDGDLQWQRWLGERIVRDRALPHALGAETFTAAGAPWVPQEWLFSTLLFLCGPQHRWLFAALIAFAATVALSISAYAAARRAAHPIAIAVATAFAGIATFQSFGVRVQVLAWPFVAAFLALLDVDGPIAYLAIVVAALWSNVHASAVLAPAVAGAAALGALVDDRRSPRARRLTIVAAGSALATCANPLGWRLPLYAVQLFASPFKTMITEWSRTSLGDLSFAFGALPLAVPLLAFGLRSWRERAVLATFGWLLLAAARNIALFGFAALPSAACALTRGIPYLRRAGDTPRSSRRMAVEPALGVALAAILFVASAQRGAATGAIGDPSVAPTAALAALERLPGRHDVFCTDFAWCSALLGQARDRVFLDGRADPYPPAVWDDYSTIVRLKPQWRARLRARGVDLVLVARAMPLEQVLAGSPDWSAVYSDPTYRIWRRVVSGGATLARH